jgi:hypothetical protein
VELPIIVRAGTVNFTAEVFSNNGILLLAGSATERISQNGFRVFLDVQPVAGLLVVFPDTLDVRASTAGASLQISNAGKGTIIWSIDAPCSRTQCVRAGKLSGQLGPGSSETVNVNGSSIQGAPPATLRVNSAVGWVDVMVRTGPNIIPQPALPRR